MHDYNYVAWFRDHDLEPDDQDYEWVACFFISAPNERAAQDWGDKLSFSYSKRCDGCEFLRSYFDPDIWEAGCVPRLTVGEKTSDELIGW